MENFTATLTWLKLLRNEGFTRESHAQECCD